MEETPFDGTLRLNEGVLVTTAEGVLTFCNSKACSVLGWDKREVRGKPLSALSASSFGLDAVLRCSQLARERGVEVREHLTRELDGRRLHITLRAFVEGDRTTVILEDATLKREMEEGLSRFVGPPIIDQLQNASLSSWQPTRTRMTIVGVEPANFSYFAERLEPHVLRDFLNDYVRKTVEIAREAEASVVKLSLPGILLGFGPPDHARRGVEAAQRVMDASRALERRCAFDGIGTAKLKVAVNTGMVVVGPVGCPERMEYTMLGSSVDVVASLLDTALAGSASITHDTQEELGDWRLTGARLLDHGPQRLFGIDRPIGVALLIRAAEAAP